MTYLLTNGLLVDKFQLQPMRRLISLAESRIVLIKDGTDVWAFTQVTPIEPNTVPS